MLKWSKNLQTGTTFVLENNTEIISTITYVILGRQNDVFLFIRLYGGSTKPSYDGQGLGGKLLKYVEETFLRDTLKVPAVTLGTSARKHPWLLDIYKRRGYEVYAEHENDDGDLGVIMRKVLIPERFDEEVLGQPPF